MSRHDHVAGGSETWPIRRLTRYEATVRNLSDRLVTALRPVRVLDAVKWDDGVERSFLASQGRELPRVTRDYYAAHPLGFAIANKAEEFADIERDVDHQLGAHNPAGRLLLRRCQEGRAVLDLLAQRGTPGFAQLSARLYGRTADCSGSTATTLAELAHRLTNTSADADAEADLDAAEARHLLAGRLTDFFKGSASVCVRLSGGMVADATAGSAYIKLRGDAHFTAREVRLLEVHEGWVHLGTTLNGRRQPICTFLEKGTPSATITQEGLAVVTEVLAFASHPGRVRRLAQRVTAVGMAEAGADFLEVAAFFRDQGFDLRESYQLTTRVFRGSLPCGCGPFTKDLAYSKGFFLVGSYIRAAVCEGRAGEVPLLFCGKTCLEDMSDITQLADEGLITPPRHLPPPFADVNALSTWVSLMDLLDKRFAQVA